MSADKTASIIPTTANNCSVGGGGEGGSCGSDSQQQRSLPTPFLTKTYHLVDDTSLNDLVSWNEDGSGFIVWKPAEFARDLLPKFFKHNNFSSFVRQLNTYGFRKVVPDRWEFANDYFRRGEKSLLRDIQRRKLPTAVPVTVAAPAPTNSGEEQAHSSNSSPAPAVVPAAERRLPAVATTAEILEENERLRRENTTLSQELNNLRGLYNNILSLMSNYGSSSGSQLGGFPMERSLPVAVAMEASPCGGSSGGGASGSGGGKGEGRDGENDDICPSLSLSPRLFGVSIANTAKRVRREIEDGCDLSLKRHQEQQGSKG